MKIKTSAARLPEKRPDFSCFKRFFFLFLVFSVVFSVIFASACLRNKDEKIIYKKKPIFVKVEAVKRGLLVVTLKYKGTVMPWKMANISPDKPGRIAGIYRKTGDTVKKGQLLAKLDTVPLELRIKQAEAVLDIAGAAYKDASVNYRRLKRLHEKQAISSLQLEKAKFALEAAETQQKSAGASLNVLKHTLRNSYMRAPFDGIVTSKNLQEGDIMNPMMGMGPAILTLMDLRKLKIAVDVPPEDIETVKIGQACDIKVSTLPDQVFKGMVYSKNLAADPISKTFKVEVKMENPGMKVKAGIFAEVTIEISRKKDLLILPLSALIVERNVSYVILYNDGVAKYKNVKVGRQNDRLFEILDGLKVGQKVVVEGNYDLKEKTPITLVGDDV